MTMADVIPGATLRDQAGHSYLVLNKRFSTFTHHSQHQPFEVEVRREDGTERWVQSGSIAAMLGEGRMTITRPAEGAAE